MPRLPFLFALFLALTGATHAALLADWKADNYTSGGNWTDSVAALVATQHGSPTALLNSFSNHKGVDVSGGRYFSVATNPLGGKTSFTLAGVFKATAAGNFGASWYQASGLIGMEQGGVVNDFGFGWTGDTGGALKAGVGFAGGSDVAVTSPAQTLNTAHAAVFTFNGATGALTLYVDGQQVATANGSTGTARNAAAFALGAMTSTGGNTFPGVIAELQMYDTVENGAALSTSLLSYYSTPQLITSFTSNKTTAYEGDAVQLSWVINTAPITGTLSVKIMRGATTIYTGTAASGSVTTNIPSLAGINQNVAYTLTATEVGGNNYVSTAQVSVQASPGIPVAASQNGLIVLATAPTPITLSATDPNAGTLTYLITTPPAHGTLTGSGAALTYTAAAGYYGTDSFVFKVNDGTYDSNLATIALTVTPPATAPSAITLSSTQIPNTKTSGQWLADISSTDVNLNETHTYTLVAGAGGADNARFTISGHQLRAAQSMAVPVGTQYSIRLRSTDGATLFFEQSFVLTVVAPSPGVVINELLYNGLNNTVLDDFIELYNPTANPVSLAGWRLSSAVDYVFPANTTIAAGGYLVIAEVPAVILSKFGKTALGPYSGSLSKDGETVRLRNAADDIVCEVDYKCGFPWPTAAGGDGTSMELINPALDPSLGSSWRSCTIPAIGAVNDTATPGAVNTNFAANAAPNIRQVTHAPQVPPSNNNIVVTAKVTDPDGVNLVQLQYQIVPAGSYLSSTVPKAISGRAFVNVNAPLAPNPAFEAAASWTTLGMNDDGVNGDAQDGDGTYSAIIPGQPNRTLVRYRIVVTDNLGASIRVPYADDASLNFACFVYDGVPSYQGISAATLQTLPVYHFITRKQDYDDCVAYDPNKQLVSGTSWTFENWEAAVVFEGVVYDHIRYRLHGGNGRYYFNGKRAFRMFFNRGSEIQNRDNDGNLYPTKWNSLVTQNCWENTSTHTFSLNEVIDFYLWNQIGIPSPLVNWGHFRTITTAAEQPDAWHGDFWGLMLIQEDYDSRFLDAHNLEKGNLYKLSRDDTGGILELRYQAPFAVTNGADHSTILNSLRGTSSPAYIDAHVNLDRWSRYHALCEAIRHYDYWPTGDNNAAYYFEPPYTAANGNLGKLWILPNDVDATWGPTWNEGHDVVHNALFSDPNGGGDTSTNPSLWPQYFNAVREIRDLLWQRDQIDPTLDRLAAVIQPFVNADFTRWFNAPADAGNFGGLTGPGMSSSVGQTSLAALVTDMKNFAWMGGTWNGGSVPTPNGRAGFLDTLQTGVFNSEGGQLPTTPTMSYLGAASHPINDLRFQTTTFSDPQGTPTFAALQWRLAEVTDPTAPAYVAGEKNKLEWNASYDSGEITAFANQLRFPAASAQIGHAYRARVRHKDNTGRWSHWSAPVQFIAGAADVSAYTSSLVISEFMYHPLPPTAAETALGWVEDDFEYLEVRNVSATSVDLTDVRLTKGVDFDFAPGTSLSAGASILVVRNVAAFNSRYGAGKPIADIWKTGDSLSNSGEEIKLSFGSGVKIVGFTYDDVSPWPVEADGLGYSLVLINPEARPNPDVAQSWRASGAIGGSPGGDDRPNFAAWAAARGVSDPNADEDGDGLANRLEYALSGNPHLGDGAIVPGAKITPVNVGGVTPNYFTLTFKRLIGAEDLSYHVELSTGLAGWSETAVPAASTLNGDGTATEVWRSPLPASAYPGLFLRLRVSMP